MPAIRFSIPSLMTALSLAVLLFALPAGAQTIYEEYEDGSISFDWSGWPFGYPSGSVSAEGPVWNEDLLFPGGATEGCGGGIMGAVGDTTRAIAIGGIINPDETYDVIAVFVNFPEGPAVGSYAADPENFTAGFAWIDNVSNLTLPDPQGDLQAWFEALEADHLYGSASGTINVTAVSEAGFEGTFSGLLADLETLNLRNLDNGQFSVVNVPVSAVPTVASRGRLSAAPNPFNPQTTVELSLDRAQSTEVAVFDMAGRRVARLHSGLLDEGSHRWVWSGRNDAGRLQSAGMYFCRAAGAGWSETTKLVLIP